jgi:hypothetical protein
VADKRAKTSLPHAHEEFSRFHGLGISRDAQALASLGSSDVFIGPLNTHMVPGGFIIETSVCMLCVLGDAVPRHVELGVRIQQLVQHKGIFAERAKEIDL